MVDKATVGFAFTSQQNPLAVTPSDAGEVMSPLAVAVVLPVALAEVVNTDGGGPPGTVNPDIIRFLINTLRLEVVDAPAA